MEQPNQDELAAKLYARWQLSVQDSRAFVAAMFKPPAPNGALRQAARRYKARGDMAIRDRGQL